MDSIRPVLNSDSLFCISKKNFTDTLHSEAEEMKKKMSVIPSIVISCVVVSILLVAALGFLLHKYLVRT